MRVKINGESGTIEAHRVDIKALNKEYHFVIKEDDHGITLFARNGQLVIHPRGANVVLVKEKNY